MNKTLTDNFMREFGMTPIELERKMYCKAHGDYVPLKDFIPMEEMCAACWEDEGKGLDSLTAHENYLNATL